MDQRERNQLALHLRQEQVGKVRLPGPWFVAVSAREHKGQPWVELQLWQAVPQQSGPSKVRTGQMRFMLPAEAIADVTAIMQAAAERSRALWPVGARRT
jgi:hypothetical protein